MEARFAGSQRVGDRRRRRLAAGVDDNADCPPDDNPVGTVELAEPAGQVRAVDGPHTDGIKAQSSTSRPLPVATIIPAEPWKYAVGGLIGLTASAVIIIAGCFASKLQALAGPELADLFAIPNGRVAQWFSSLLLLLSSQLALLIWWTRSRSLEDFEGRYWLWIRTACVWFALSACTSIDVHNVAVETLLTFRPDLSRVWANLCWMLPVAIPGTLLFAALAREMRGCRASRALLFLAGACHLSTAGFHLSCESAFSPVAQAVLVQFGLLTGQVALFVSMWLHARHVLYCTADPAPASTRTFRIPRPHFRMPQWRLRPARQSDGEVLEPQSPLKGPKSRRKRPVKEAADELASGEQPESIPSQFGTSPVERSKKPRIRFDNRHLERSQLPAAEGIDAEDGGESADSAGNGYPGQSATESNSGEDGAAEPDDDSEAEASKPELRGLSKKQRRRLMQELRDRERDSKP